MCSYNGLDGIPACSNPKSLGKWLHEELNYQGWVLSDYGAIYEGYEIDSANAGCDSILGFTVNRETRNSTGACELLRGAWEDAVMIISDPCVLLCFHCRQTRSAPTACFPKQ